MKKGLFNFTLWVSTILICCMVLFAAPALSATDTTEEGMTAGISLGLSNSSYDHHVGMVVRPNVGYRFNRTWEAGAFFRFENNGWGDKIYNLSLYGEYNFFPFVNQRFSLFVDFQAGKGWVPTYYDFAPGSSKHRHHTDVEIGFVPGIKYHIPGTQANLRLRYLFVGYNNYSGYNESSDASLGGDDWGIDAALRRLEIGISVNF